MKPPLTPEQKEEKRIRDAHKSLQNRIASAFSFSGAKGFTWGEVYKFTSIPPSSTQEQLQTKLTYAQLKEYFQKLDKELEEVFKNKHNSLVANNSQQRIDNKISNNEIEATKESIEERTECTKNESTKIEEPSIENDYLLPSTKRETKSLIKYWFQRKAAKEILDLIQKANAQGIQLIAAAGYGKTFIAGAVACRLIDSKFTEGKTYGAVTYLYVTKATIVEQTKRVFEKAFSIGIRDGFEVINYEQLRAKAGQLWVKEKLVVEGGEEKFIWEWRPMINPVVIFWDENQSLKNYSSVQHKIACSFNEIKTPIYQVFISATPYTRVSEAKCFAVSTRKNIRNIIGMDVSLSNDLWPTYAASMAGEKSKPEEYNEAAVERLTKDLEKYIVRVTGVRPQFHAINKIQMIDFDTKEEAKYYAETEERYLREKTKLEEGAELGVIPNAGLLHLVLLTKRAIAAEYCRRRHFAKFLWQAVQSGKAGALAVKYKTTLIPVVKILIEDYGFTRDQISLVWGGGQTQLTKKQKVKAQIQEKADALIEAGMSKEEVFKALDLEDVEDRVLEELPPEMRLGNQSKEERQREIDKFQMGKTLICIYTFKAGGVGLSLHHTDELTQQKVRRQKNGYAIIEDIPNVPTRQRTTALSVAYSAIDMVQSTGRVPRLTSLSDTEQFCMLYNGTVEVDIARIYSQKLRCLAKCVKNRESWIDLIVNHNNRGQLVQAHLEADNEVNNETDPETLLGGESEEE